MTDQWVPDACTLATAQRPLRLAEFDQLFTASARAADRLTPHHLRVTIPGGPDVEARVRDLADRESRCCAFFTFTVSAPDPAIVQLDIEVPPLHRDVLDALQARATTVRGAL